MNQDLEIILKASTFKILDGEYAYVKVKRIPETQDYFALIQDKQEITIVSEVKQLKSLEIIKKQAGYALIALNVSVPFYSVGFLASVSNAIAAQGMNILIVSTFSKDYILVKHEKLEMALEALRVLGIKNA